MNSRSNTARQCYLVLSSLLTDIQQEKSSIGGIRKLSRSGKSSPQIPIGRHDSTEPASKRQRIIQPDTDSKPQSDMSPPDFSPPMKHDQQRFTEDSNQSHVQYSQMPSVPSITNDNSPFAGQTASNWNDGQPATYPGFETMNTAPMYANTQDFSYPQPGANMQDYTTGSNDPNIWANYGYNMADVFESATWEHLIGSAGPMPFGWDSGV